MKICLFVFSVIIDINGGGCIHVIHPTMHNVILFITCIAWVQWPYIVSGHSVPWQHQTKYISIKFKGHYYTNLLISSSKIYILIVIFIKNWLWSVGHG